jgi:hypothetical protein
MRWCVILCRCSANDVVSRFDAGGMIPEGFETRPSGRKTAAGVMGGGELVSG